MKKKRKHEIVAIDIGRLGPAENLRPAGAHKDRRRIARSKIKVALKKEPLDE